ncbi:MAG: M81 family metallopeptidase, partial [Thermomicrobiales bacterium]|nr:M81 family metallopeptidase [Thermomicrobiales bacterium]
AECKQEVSTFNPALSGRHDFVYSSGDDIAAFHDGIDSEIGGALEVFREAGAEIVGGYSARAISSAGTLAADAWDSLAADFLDGMERAWSTGGFDGIYLSMHGAMCAQNESDPEGYLLQETRRIVGEAVPIVCSFDLHGIVTERMLSHIDGFTAYWTYPHNDFADTGARAARLLLRIIRDGVEPVMALVRVPALVRGDELITATGLIKGRIDECQAFEAAGGLSGSMFWGNPFTDVPELSSYAIMISDGDEQFAIDAATKSATNFWADRAAMQAPLIGIEAAVERAQALKDSVGGTVVLIDAADATSSGASGDSNAILRGLIKVGYDGSVLFPIVDAPAVEAAIAAGIGSTITVKLGGTLDPARFEPLEVEAYVRLLSDGRMFSETFGVEWYGGKTAVLEIGKMVVCVTSRAVALLDRTIFYACGQDPKRFDCVIQKSPHCRYELFAEWATELIGVDAPGSTSANLPYLGHTVCARPMYPMEPDATFTPEPNVFRRRS